MIKSKQIVIIHPASKDHSIAAALGKGLGLDVLTKDELGKPEQKTLLFLDVESARPDILSRCESAIVCVPADAPLESCQHLTFTNSGERIRRLVVQTPLHQLYALERLKWPTGRLELIPPLVDLSEFVADEKPRAESRIAIFKPEPCSGSIDQDVGLGREAQSIVITASDRAKCIEELRTASVVIVTSSNRESGEGARELMMAMAAGAPIVAPRTWGMEHLMVEEGEGLFHSFGNNAERRDCVRKLLGEPELATQLGKCAASKMNSIAKQIHHIERIRRILMVSKERQEPEFNLIPAHGRAEFNHG